MRDLIVIFILNLIISTLSQLKYIFSAKSRDWKLYVLIAVDTIVYLYSLELILSQSSWLAMVSLTVGKLLGITVAGYLEDKLVKKIYSYNIYFSDLDIVEDIEKELYKQNISITTLNGFSNGKPRYQVTVQGNSSQIDYLFTYMKDVWKIDEPTAYCAEIKKTFGKIKHRVQN